MALGEGGLLGVVVVVLVVVLAGLVVPVAPAKAPHRRSAPSPRRPARNAQHQPLASAALLSFCVHRLKTEEEVKSLKQLALLAFVRALERGAQFHGYLQLDLHEGELLRAVVTLLARRGKLSSTTLRPFLHLVTQLDLSGASASLNLAKTVSRAPHLSALAVRGRLCDSMAASLHAPCLVSLDCSCSPRLTVAGLGSLALSCPLLASLSCSWCGGIDSLSSLSSLSHLSVLDASQCPVAEGCCWPPRLVRLSLGGCSSLRRAGGWPESLEQLDLSRCVELVELTHSFPAALRELSAVALPAAAELDRAAGGCGRLAWLDLSETELRGPPAACRAGLQSLLMERCGEGAALGAMPMLTVLSLSGGQLRGGDWAASLPSLSTLCLSHTPLGDRDVAAVLAALPALQRLDLSFCEGLTDAALEAVRTGGSGLLLLRLYGCPQLSLAALRRLAHACPHMRLCAPTSE